MMNKIVPCSVCTRDDASLSCLIKKLRRCCRVFYVFLVIRSKDPSAIPTAAIRLKRILLNVQQPGTSKQKYVSPPVIPSLNSQTFWVRAEQHNSLLLLSIPPVSYPLLLHALPPPTHMARHDMALPQWRRRRQRNGYMQRNLVGRMGGHEEN